MGNETFYWDGLTDFLFRYEAIRHMIYTHKSGQNMFLFLGSSTSALFLAKSIIQISFNGQMNNGLCH